MRYRTARYRRSSHGDRSAAAAVVVGGGVVAVGRRCRSMSVVLSTIGTAEW